MRLRVILGAFLVRLGGFIQSLAIMVMKPDDLVEFSRQSYAKSQSVDAWSVAEIVDSGLDSVEKELLEKVPFGEGRLLLMGLGGGREAISLSKLGFEVTGIDFVSDMVKKSIENAKEKGVHITGLAQEISNLEVPTDYYNIVWLSTAMYSCVPTRKRRVKMLKRINDTLKPEGYFICQFYWNHRNNPSPKVAFIRKVAEFIRKAFAFLTLGNLSYEKGDMLWYNTEFIHVFSTEDEIRREFEDGGFDLVYIYIAEKSIRGGAVLRKKYILT